MESHKFWKEDQSPKRRHVEEVAPSPVTVEGTSPIKIVKQQCLLDGENKNIELTVKDVCDRLCIKGAGEEVMAYVDSDND